MFDLSNQAGRRLALASGLPAIADLGAADWLRYPKARTNCGIENGSDRGIIIDLDDFDSAVPFELREELNNGHGS